MHVLIEKSVNRSVAIDICLTVNFIFTPSCCSWCWFSVTLITLLGGFLLDLHSLWRVEVTFPGAWKQSDLTARILLRPAAKQCFHHLTFKSKAPQVTPSNTAATSFVFIYQPRTFRASFEHYGTCWKEALTLVLQPQHRLAQGAPKLLGQGLPPGPLLQLPAGCSQHLAVVLLWDGSFSCLCGAFSCESLRYCFYCALLLADLQ